MRRVLIALAAVATAAVLAGLWLSRTVVSPIEIPADYMADPVAGEMVFWASGCASCHASPVEGKRATGDAKLLLGGGLELDTPFGLFVVPNISAHREDGIGDWSSEQFIAAMRDGVSPDGSHYYPSFPYTSYTRMEVTELIDLKAFLDGLQPVAGTTADHELAFPYSVRRGVGLWKRQFLDSDWVIEVADDEKLLRGRALVEGAGHCGECHTPRNASGAMDTTRWLQGGPNPDGEGTSPGITASGKNTAVWTASDLAYYFESGFTPDWDSVGGSMVAVQENLAKLSADDRMAIAPYLQVVD